MESSRVRTIVNLYAELKAKGERFKDVEPCFIEGNQYLAKLWTTANADGGSGTENPDDIDIPIVGGQGTEDGGQQTGTVIGTDGKPVKGKSSGKGEGQEGEGGDGEGDGDGEGEGEGEGEGQGKGKGKGKGKDGDGEDGDGNGKGKDGDEGDGEDEGGEDGGQGKGKGKDKKKKQFKVGDKVRVKKTGAVGTITKINDDGTYEIGEESDIKDNSKSSYENISKDISVADINEDDGGQGTRHHGKAEGTFGGDEIEPYNEDEEDSIEAPAPPETVEPEFEEEIENLLGYKLKFPFVTEMLYGIKICNTSDYEQGRIIEKKLVVGIGITICRNLMAETGRYGESVMSAKKESYRGIFRMIMILIQRMEEYDAEGNILTQNAVVNDEESLKELVIADKFINKTLPILAVFNKENFNEKQLDNAIDFCMARLNEVDTMLVSEKYTEQIDEVVWGMIIKEMDDRKNYKITYYKNDWNLVSKDGRRVSSKVTDRVNAITVSKGKLEYSIGLNEMGDRFYGFVWSLIFNYLNNTTQTLEEQSFKYKLKKNLILEASTSVFSAYLLDVEKQFD